MHVKIMHHCAFLIITFSTYTLCIQNGKTDSVSQVEGSPYNLYAQARQSTFHQSDYDTTGFIPSTGTSSSSSSSVFRFPDKQPQPYTNELPPSHRYTTNPYPNNNQRANPHNLALNTGEYPSNAANNHNNYPYRPHPNAIASFANRDSPNVPNANDFYLSTTPQQHLYYKNPNYPPQRYQSFQQRPTYAEAYDNYLFNRQPNYNRRPPPPSYSPYQDGHLTPPYRNDDLTSPSSSSSSSLTGPAGASTYPSQYANQFGNFILPFIGGGGGGGANANPLGGLLNSIGVPFAGGNPLSMQIIQGLENIARNDDLQCVPKVLCQMLGSPTRRAQLPGFITSPVVTSFVSSLPASSPALIFGRAALLGLSGGEYSCSRTYAKCPQNEDDILYYLNNHRGGFFKFFSEPGSQPVLEPQHSSSSSSSSSSQSQPSIFNFLTGLSGSTASSSNSGNLNSFASDAVTNGIGSLFGNIISGFLSGQPSTTATRRKDDDVHSDLIESNSTTDSTEGRILNNKSNILAFVEPHRNPISFPPGGHSNDNYEAQQFETEFRFPSAAHRDVEADYRRGKKVNFIDSDAGTTRTKMIFPDRTGTGNLRFDNEEYFRVGKIMNRPSYTETTTSRIPNYTKSPSSYASNSYLNRYVASTKDEEDTSGNVYVTNGQGVIEYYINAKGRKVYV